MAVVILCSMEVLRASATAFHLILTETKAAASL